MEVERVCVRLHDPRTDMDMSSFDRDRQRKRPCNACDGQSGSLRMGRDRRRVYAPSSSRLHICSPRRLTARANRFLGRDRLEWP
jgi:hypothetical protein